MRKFLLLPLVCYLLFNNAAVAKPFIGKTLVYPKVCREGLHYSPNKQFCVYVFCSPDAAGTSIGVIAKDWRGIMMQEDTAIWDVAKRFWQDSVWASDVQEFQWSKDGRYLQVTTGDIYGTGKKYELDLLNKGVTEMGEGYHAQ